MPAGDVLVAQYAQAVGGVGSEAAEALRAEVVRHADLGEPREHGASALPCARLDVAQPNRESVAAQVSHAELVLVAAPLEHLDPIGLVERVAGLCEPVRHADPLPGDGAFVLESGNADAPTRHARGDEHVDEVLGRAAALAHVEVEVRAFAGGEVAGQLHDTEVLELGA